jgi:hypothetical protein
MKLDFFIFRKCEWLVSKQGLIQRLKESPEPTELALSVKSECASLTSHEGKSCHSLLNTRFIYILMLHNVFFDYL